MTESNELYLPYSLFVILFFWLLLPLLLFDSHFVFNLPLVCVRVCACERAYVLARVLVGLCVVCFCFGFYSIS